MTLCIQVSDWYSQVKGQTLSLQDGAEALCKEDFSNHCAANGNVWLRFLLLKGPAQVTESKGAYTFFSLLNE